MKKRLLSLALGTMMVLSTLAGCGSKDGGSATVNTKPEEQGKVLNIYCWNEEFKSRFEGYYKNVPSDVKVNWVITPNENNAYQNALDAALLKQKDAAADDKIDMFLIEADYALKYVNSDYTLDVKDVGLTDDDLKDMYQYTKDIATDSKGKLKATTWQATPGLFAYRRSIAKDVLGTDDPDKVQEALSTWDKFDKVAEQAAAKGYKMLSGYDDSYRVFSNNVSGPWVDSNNKIVIDDNIMKWVDQTKKYTDKGYNNKSSLWDSTWAAGDGVGAAESAGLADGCGVVDGPNTAGIMKRNDIRKNTPKVDKNMRMIPLLCRFAIHPSICAENENKCWQAGKIVIY